MSRPTCVTDGCDRLSKCNGRKKNGDRKYKKMCNRCHGKKYYPDKYSSNSRSRVGANKGSECVFCGFVAVHRCQLDVDHIDGNRNNNSKDNLQTLCANCHRLKTFINEDWRPKY